MFRQVNLLLVLAGMIAGPLVVSAWMARRTLRGLAVRRKLPQQLAAGEMLLAGLTVDNPRRRLGAWAVVVEDEVQREGDGPHDGVQRPRVIFPYVPAGHERKATYRGAMPRRGRYRFGPLRLSTRFPFGLFAVTHQVGRDANPDGAAAAGPPCAGLVDAPPPGHRRRATPRGTPRPRGRLFRAAAVARRRQPPLDPLAHVRPARATHGP